MPKRTDIKSVLIIGAGPIVIGQACESTTRAPGLQGAAREGTGHPGQNSNPATIMTDPIRPDVVPTSSRSPGRWSRPIIARKSGCVAATMGGRPALNGALIWRKTGVLALTALN